MSDTQNKPNRRRYQFNLRTLVIFVTLLALPLGWVGWVGSKIAQARRERVAITWVINQGGIIYAHELNKTSSWNERIDRFLGLGATGISLDNTEVRDISPLTELYDLEWLAIYGTQVGDVSPLAELKNLEHLYLDSTRVSKEQVQILKQALPNCQIHFTPHPLTGTPSKIPPLQ